MTEFVLDRAENPHPRLLAGAISAYKDRDLSPSVWTGYLAAMIDATGCSREDLVAWVAFHMNPPTVYLAGPINGCSDEEANGWRSGFMGRLPGYSFLDPMVRDYRGREDECVAEIVELDCADVRACDVFLAYCWQVSWGTAMEIYYAHSLGKYVLLVVPEGMRISPWLRYHSNAIVSTLEEAEAAIRALPDRLHQQ